MRKTSGNWGKIGREEKSGGRIREKMTKSGGKSGEFGRKGQNREVSRNSGESGNPANCKGAGLEKVWYPGILDTRKAGFLAGC